MNNLILLFTILFSISCSLCVVADNADLAKALSFRQSTNNNNYGLLNLKRTLTGKEEVCIADFQTCVDGEQQCCSEGNGGSCSNLYDLIKFIDSDIDIDESFKRGICLCKLTDFGCWINIVNVVKDLIENFKAGKDEPTEGDIND